MKVCIVGGCGHADSVAEAAERGSVFELGGICPSFSGDVSTEYLIERFRKCGMELRRYDDMEEMLCAEHPDIAVIDGIFGHHAQAACYALHQGMHVLCDKPAAVTQQQYEEICRTARKSGKLYWSILTSRYDPWFATAKRLTEEGTIGELRLIDGQKSYKLGQRPAFYSDPLLYGGTIAWVGIHMIDLVLWITGKPCRSAAAFGSAKANAGHGSLESAVICNMELEDGVLASICADYLRSDFASTHGDDRIRIVGTKGSIEVREETVYLLNETSPVLRPVPNDMPVSLFAEFLAAAEKGQTARIDCAQSLYTTQVALALTQSLRENRVVTLDGKGDLEE